MSEAVMEKARLAPETPEAWLDDGFEPLVAMTWQDVEEAQNQAIKLRFDKLKDKVQALKKLAEKEGVTEVGGLDEALPLFFDHRVLKNYPMSLLEKRDFPKLTAWLDRLTSKDLSKMDLSGLNSIDSWLDRLDDFGMFVSHSSGTSGKLSFVPRSADELPAMKTAQAEVVRAMVGIDPRTDNLPTFSPGYRGGHYLMFKLQKAFGDEFAGGPEHVHTLYQTSISADLMCLAGRIQAAEERGELDSLGLDPELIRKRDAMIEQGKRRDQDSEAWFFKLFEEFRGKRVRMGGTPPELVRITRIGMEKGVRPEFAPNSYLMSGGGMKGAKGAPDDWEKYVQDYFGIEKFAIVYGMSESIAMHVRCSCKKYHILPTMVPVLFDRDMKPLPRKGTQTGRYAIFDLAAQTYWGGFITGDKVTIHWDGDCACGWKTPYVDPDVVRFSDLEDDDKITCAGTQQAYNDFMDYVLEG
jgi:hypothetical protein